MKWFLLGALIIAGGYAGMRYHNALHRHDGLWVRDTMMEGREQACAASRQWKIAPDVMEVRGTVVAFEQSTCQASWYYPLRARIRSVMGWHSKLAYRAVAFTCIDTHDGASHRSYFSLDSHGGDRLLSTGYLIDEDAISINGEPNGPFDGFFWEIYSDDLVPITAYSSYVRCPAAP
jgi:hypothetical protein